MHYSLVNDQSVLADGLLLEDELISQAARLNYTRVYSYRYTILRPSLRLLREQLREEIRRSLFHFVAPRAIVASALEQGALHSN